MKYTAGSPVSKGNNFKPRKNQFLLLMMIKIHAKALSADYITYTASNRQEALDILPGNKDIEIVLTDINMPEMDGFELIKKYV